MDDGGSSYEDGAPSSFTPWASRVRQARAWGAIAAFVLVGGLLLSSGRAWPDATIGGLVAAAVGSFLAWASALWICGELHAAEQRSRRVEVERMEQARREELQALYRQRVEDQGDADLLRESRLEAEAAATQRRTA